MLLEMLRQLRTPTQRSSRVTSLTSHRDGPGRPYSLPQTRMPQANPKERVSFGSERSSALCFRLCKAKEGSDRKTLSAPVEQKAKEDGDRKPLSASAWLQHASSDREGSGGRPTSKTCNIRKTECSPRRRYCGAVKDSSKAVADATENYPGAKPTREEVSSP